MLGVRARESAARTNHVIAERAESVGVNAGMTAHVIPLASAHSARRAVRIAAHFSGAISHGIGPMRPNNRLMPTFDRRRARGCRHAFLPPLEGGIASGLASSSAIRFRRRSFCIAGVSPSSRWMQTRMGPYFSEQTVYST